MRSFIHCADYFHKFHFRFHGVTKLYQVRLFEKAKRIGLFPGQPPILFILSDKKECTQKELGGLLGVRPASMTNILQRMEKMGLISRHTDEKDLRVSLVCLTEKGNDLVSKVHRIEEEMERECFKGFSQEEKEVFGKMLERIFQNLGESWKEEGGEKPNEIDF